MKKVLLVLANVLVTTLAACGNRPMSEMERTLAEIGTPVSSLPLSSHNFDSAYVESKYHRALTDFDWTFNEEHGVVMFTPTDLDQNPWVTMLPELANGEIENWNSFVRNLELRFIRPDFSRHPRILLNPFNNELFWLKLDYGIVYSSFELTPFVCRYASCPLEMLDMSYLHEWVAISYSVWFSENPSEILAVYGDRVRYRHPVYNNVELIFHSNHTPFDYPISIDIPINMVINRDAISMEELRLFTGGAINIIDNPEGVLKAIWSMDDIINGSIILTSINDADIERITINRLIDDGDYFYVTEDYDCFQVTEFPTDWAEMFELSFCEWFGHVIIENVGTPSGGVWYRHPVIDDIILIWPHSHHRAFDGTVSMILPISVFMGQDHTTVAELREIFGSELDVAFSDFNDSWMAWLNINDYFHARIYLESEYDENITQLIVNRGQPSW